MKRYLFKNNHNGFYFSYHPFEVSESLTQEKCNELILSVSPSAHRIGSSVDHLLEALDKVNIKVKRYYSSYYKEGENEEKYNSGLDPLPNDMYKWDVIKGISGNY